MFCPHCGSKIDDDLLYCPICGESIDPSLSDYLKEGTSSEASGLNESSGKADDYFSKESSYGQGEEERNTEKIGDHSPSASPTVPVKNSLKSFSMQDLFRKKVFWIAAIATAVVIAAAVVVIIITSNASAVDKKYVGLWYVNDEDALNSSCFNIEKNGKCSGFGINWLGSVVAFRGDCKTDEDALTIEVKEVVSTYQNEEDVLSNDSTIGYLVLGCQYYDPTLSFTEINSSGKGYFAKEVLISNYESEPRMFVKTDDKDVIKAYPDAISQLFTEIPEEKNATANQKETSPQEETTTEPETTTAPKETQDYSNECQQRVTLSGAQLILENRKSADEWEETFSCPAKISVNGTGTDYSESSGKTPQGTFKILFGMGTKKPDTSLKFKKVKKGDVWVDDSNSKYYNTLQKGSLKGKDWNSFEDIYSYFSSGTVNDAIFFDYNGDGESANSAVSGRGSALFLLGRNDYNTASSKYGDIYISAQDMTILLSYLDSEKNPEIVIQPSQNTGATGSSSGITPGCKYSLVDELMFRTGPGTTYQAMNKLYEGDEVTVVEEKNGWTHCTFKGQDGWVDSNYLTELKPVYFMAIEQNYGPAIQAISIGMDVSSQYRGEDSAYVYCQVYWGGGWRCVKVQKAAPYSVEEMTDAERAQYEHNPYPQAGGG